MKSIIILLCTISAHLLSGQSMAQSTPGNSFIGVKELKIKSEILNEERTVYIYSPENKNNKKLPVLYILDGAIPDLYQEALQTIENYPHVVVGIRTHENRARDMIPVNVSMYEYSGRADRFLKFLTDELMPIINENYSTNNQNILYGGSNAGLFTTFAMLTCPEHFHGFISSSTTIGHCKDFMHQKAIELSPKSKLNGKNMYIYYGLKDPSPRVVGYIEDFNQLLIDKFSDIMYIGIKELPDKGHVPAGGIRSGVEFIYNAK